MNWQRIAFPQKDLYDSRAIREIGLKHIREYACENEQLLFTCFEDKIKVAHIHPHCLYTDMENFHPGQDVFLKAEQYLRLWPEVYGQVPYFVNYINPIQSDFFAAEPLGSSSGCSSDEFGVIYLTANHPFPLAEAIVHEMAHLKLIALGVDYEKATALITNDPGQLYYSPVRQTGRPMTAVFHAQYSFMHILNLDVLMLEASKTDPLYMQYISLAGDTLSKMQEGHLMIQQNIQADKDGIAFINSFMIWSEAVMEKASGIITNYSSHEQIAV